ncbi:MAG: hypothetical protein RMK97_00450 [Sutterellaceae bacterium]|nr:hypothetical protein [Burkholderiaceae bacterium]MCX7901100.1 hypothetical protein [Burkholderiaceae bacterium]MDW8428972.1 hypothetical protein [Sutterellaceae bacterium]
MKKTVCRLPVPFFRHSAVAMAFAIAAGAYLGDAAAQAIAPTNPQNITIKTKSSPAAVPTTHANGHTEGRQNGPCVPPTPYWDPATNKCSNVPPIKRHLSGLPQSDARSAANISQPDKPAIEDERKAAPKPEQAAGGNPVQVPVPPCRLVNPPTC